MIVWIRIIVLWCTFLCQAMIIAQWVARGSGLGDVALIISVAMGAPLSLLLAIAGARKRLLLSACAGTCLIVLASLLTLREPYGNPLLLAAAMPVVAAVIWLALPDAPLGDGRNSCSRCGYLLRGLVSGLCPECGTKINGIGRSG